MMNLVLVVMNLVLTVRVGRESGEGESAKW